MGDLNAKLIVLEAEKNNSNGEILQEIVLNYDCLILNNKNYTHHCFNGNTASILDYCIVSSNIHDLFDSFHVLENVDVTSDHVPIMISFKHERNDTANQNNSSNLRKIYN